MLGTFVSLVDSRGQSLDRLESLISRNFEESTRGLVILAQDANIFRDISRLKKVSICGRSILKNFDKLEEFDANPLVLWGSKVVGSVNAGVGDVRIVSSDISETLYFKGRRLEVKSSTIDKIQVNIEGEGQVIELIDSNINTLKITGARFNSFKKSIINGMLYYKSSFILIGRDVNIGKIESEGKEVKALS